MLSNTLSDGLRQYAIGEKVRALRLQRRMGLVELGRHTRLSPAMISKLERGKLFPTLPTLLRIALAFGVGLDYFFAEPRQRPALAVVRKRDRQRFPEHADGGPVAYHFESLDYPIPERRFNSYFVEFEPVEAGAVRRHDHAGAEFIYVIEGQLGLSVAGEQEVVLGPEDAIYLDPAQPHGYRRIGETACRALLVTAVP